MRPGSFEVTETTPSFPAVTSYRSIDHKAPLCALLGKQLTELTSRAFTGGRRITKPLAKCVMALGHSFVAPWSGAGGPRMLSV